MTAASLLTLLPAFALGWGLTAWLWPRPAQAEALRLSTFSAAVKSSSAESYLPSAFRLSPRAI